MRLRTASSMNSERLSFFPPWASRNVRRAKSVSLETMMFQRTGFSIPRLGGHPGHLTASANRSVLGFVCQALRGNRHLLVGFAFFATADLDGHFSVKPFQKIE